MKTLLLTILMIIFIIIGTLLYLENRNLKSQLEERNALILKYETGISFRDSMDVHLSFPSEGGELGLKDSIVANISEIRELGSGKIDAMDTSLIQWIRYGVPDTTAYYWQLKLLRNLSVGDTFFLTDYPYLLIRIKRATGNLTTYEVDNTYFTVIDKIHKIFSIRKKKAK